MEPVARRADSLLLGELCTDQACRRLKPQWTHGHTQNDASSGSASQQLCESGRECLYHFLRQRAVAAKEIRQPKLAHKAVLHSFAILPRPF